LHTLGCSSPAWPTVTSPTYSRAQRPGWYGAYESAVRSSRTPRAPATVSANAIACSQPAGTAGRSPLAGDDARHGHGLLRQRRVDGRELLVRRPLRHRRHGRDTERATEDRAHLVQSQV